VTTEVKFDFRKRLAALRRNRERGPKLIAHALDRAADSAKATIARGISDDIKASVTSVKEQIRVTRDRDVNPQRQTRNFYANAKRIPLIDFRARGREPSLGKGRGVTARTKTGRYPRAFIATMKSGHRGVFQRNPGAKRLGIYELDVVSIAHVFPKHAPAGVERAREQLAKNLAANLRFLSGSAAA